MGTLLNADPIKGNKELKKSVMVLAKVVKTSYRTKPLSYPAPPAVAAFVGEWADGTRAATETFLRQVVEISDDSIVEVVRQIAEDRKAAPHQRAPDSQRHAPRDGAQVL